jgi:glucan phosphoethanolaminetransferase (alkaline phosphatase superfamily)
MYPQVCSQVPIKEADYYPDSTPDHFVGPIDLARKLITLPCSISIQREQCCTLLSLIMEARHYMMNMRNSFQFLLCSCLSLSFAQLLSSLIFLPPMFSPGLIIWLVIIALPSLSASLMGTPPDEEVMNMATGKNLHLSKEVLMITFLLKLCHTNFDLHF